MQWFASAAIVLGAIIGTVLVALAVTACIQGWGEGGIVDLPTND
jgi:hypothetical protein